MTLYRNVARCCPKFAGILLEFTEFCRNSNFHPLFRKIQHFGTCHTHSIVALATISWQLRRPREAALRDSAVQRKPASDCQFEPCIDAGAANTISCRHRCSVRGLFQPPSSLSWARISSLEQLQQFWKFHSNFKLSKYSQKVKRRFPVVKGPKPTC